MKGNTLLFLLLAGGAIFWVLHNSKTEFQTTIPDPPDMPTNLTPGQPILFTSSNGNVYKGTVLSDGKRVAWDSVTPLPALPA